MTQAMIDQRMKNFAFLTGQAVGSKYLVIAKLSTVMETKATFILVNFNRSLSETGSATNQT